jgi:hypothetical protein
LPANDGWLGVAQMTTPYAVTYHDPTWIRWRPYHVVLKVVPQAQLTDPDYCTGFSQGYLEYSERDFSGPIYQCTWRLIRVAIDPPNHQIDVYFRAKSPRSWSSFFFFNLKSWFFPMPFGGDGHHGTGGIKVVGSSATTPGSFGGTPPYSGPHEDIETFAITIA